MIRFASRALLLVPFLAVISVLVLADQGKPAFAGTAFAPTRFDDPAPDGCQPADCSLREAIIAANDASGGDQVILEAGTYSLSIGGPPEGAAAMGDLDIIDDLTVTGMGADATAISGGHIDRVFDVVFGNFFLSSVAIQDGQVEDYGGGIRNSSDLTLERVTIRDNLSIGNLAGQIFHGGGGIFNQGTLTLKDSTISANEGRESAGGGLYNTGTATVTNSTISGNQTTGGGFGAAGVYQSSGTLLLVNTTISDNTASGMFGAGIRTLSGGSATNTIIAGNTPDDCGGNGGAMISLGHNLGGDASCEFNAAGDLLSTDAMLGPLADNGGQTATRALLGGSPAINAGDDGACPFTDQRGFGRVDVCDIGAYEFGGALAAVKQGDVNCDDAVTAVDALFMLRFVAGIPPAAECLDIAGDVNCDGANTAVDALGVLRFVAGLPVNQNEPCTDVGLPV